MIPSDHTIVIVVPPPSSLVADDHTREHALTQIRDARTNPLTPRLHLPLLYPVVVGLSPPYTDDAKEGIHGDGTPAETEERRRILPLY